MSLIKFSLIKFEKCLLFQVHEQCVSITRLDTLIENTKNIFNGDHFSIKSCDCPEISVSVIYLRGKTKSDDSKVAKREFRNNEERDLAYNKIINTFKKWSGKNNI